MIGQALRTWFLRSGCEICGGSTLLRDSPLCSACAVHRLPPTRWHLPSGGGIWTNQPAGAR